MNPDSPMMRRVHRDSFSKIPRKGRIRAILILVSAALVVNFGPSLLQALPETETPEAHSVAASKPLPEPPLPETVRQPAPPPKKIVQNKARQKFTADTIPDLLSDHPECFNSNRATISTNDNAYIVFTSIDTALQNYAAKLMRRYHPLYGALVAIDPVSGRVRAAVSYTNDSMPDLGGNLCFRSLFPAASVFKTITAAAAIELADYTASCTVQHKGKNHTLYKSQIERELAWSVDMPFAKAYARSINPVFARIGMYDVGAHALYQFSKKMGFCTQLPGEIPCDISKTFLPDSAFECAELASGFNQRTVISPLHGALIAASVAENGAFLVPTLVDSIRNRDNSSLVYERDNSTWCQFIQPATARRMQKLMTTVVRAGTARKHFRRIRNSRRFDDFLFGGKTGSVDKDSIGRVDWFVGFAKHPKHTDERLVVGVVTVHGAYWTVNSSYLGAETFRTYLRTIQKQKKKQLENTAKTTADTLPSS